MALFTRKRNVSSFRYPSFFEKLLTLVKEVKYLDVVIEEKLSWKPHIYSRYVVDITTMWQVRPAVGKNLGISLPTIVYKSVVR